MSRTRSSLIRRVRDLNDSESWREFDRLYRPLLLGYVRALGLPDSAAEDVVQNILASLVRTLPHFDLDHSRGRFRTWLWQVTRNAVVDWVRKQQRDERARQQWAERVARLQQRSDPDPDWLAAYRRRILQHVLEQVRQETRPRSWACFQQHLLAGRPGAAVAAELGITTNQVYVNASRVLARVRQRCQEYMEGELSDE